MKFRDQKVPLTSIDSDNRTFRITTRTSVEDLVASIARIGLLNPPILNETDSGYAIVSGFRRVAACRHLGWEAIPARIMPLQTSAYDCCLVAIGANTFERPLNLVEQSRALNLLYTYSTPNNAHGKTAALLGLPENPSLIKKIRSLARLGADIQTAVLSGDVSLSMALALGKLDDLTGRWLAEMFRNLKLSLNKQREIIQYLSEISKIENISIHTVLSEPIVRETLETNDLDRTQKTRIIRQHLYRRRFPTLSSVETQFQRHRQMLKLGPGIDLKPPHNFEGRAYMLTVPLSEPEDLDRLQKTIARLRRHKSLAAILSKKFHVN